METNNKQFQQLRYVLYIALFIMIIGYFFLPREFLFICSILVILLLYIQNRSMIVNLYQTIRTIVEAIYHDTPMEILDGDLGILYEEVNLLKRRTIAYEKTIDKEKEKLRTTMEDICHQIKTPLTSINIYNQLLEDHYDVTYLKESQTQIEKIEYFINSLLHIAKLESNQVKFDFQKQSLNYILNLSLQSIHSLIENNDITVILPQNDITFYYDESWLQEALTNILKNNMEHGCHSITITVHEHDQYFKLFIQNDGDEIDACDLPHIFERFYHTNKQQGVGIGLALSKEIIHQHHGEIDVYNHNGVIFELLFPLSSLNETYHLS